MSSDAILVPVLLLVIAVPLAFVLGTFALGALSILRGSGSRKAADQEAEETRLIQDIYHGLLKMEERVEALKPSCSTNRRKETDPL